MWKKPYGRTGKQVSAIAFGGMRFPAPDDLDAMAEIVLHAHRRGINYFDTAPGYCKDRSEDIFGLALQSLPRGSYLVSTKSGAAEGDALRRSLERSLQRLHVEQIDFFHVWCLIRPEQLPDRIAKGAVGALLKARDEGLVRHVVMSSHLGGGDLRAVIKTGLFEGMTVGYNALNFPFRSEGLALARRKGMGVVTMNPLGGGLIPQNAERLAFLKGPHDRDVVQAALRFNVSHPAVTAALVGFQSCAEVDAAVEAVEAFKPYGARHIARLKREITAGFEGFCTGCGYCLPCPAGVPIPALMDTFNLQILGNGPQDLSNRLRWHWGLQPAAAEACTGCGACEKRCTQHLPIRERIRTVACLPKS